MAENKKIIILGISCFYHDSAAALLIDGQIVAAGQEERFSRVKHDSGFPQQAIDYCLQSQNLTVADLDYVVFYDKPILKFERLLLTYIKVWPRGLVSFIAALKVWLKEKLWIENLISKKLKYNKEILFVDHHFAHAASSYFASDFSRAAILTMDGVGEWDTTTLGYGEGNGLKLTKTIHFPHSLGLLYSALTYYLGFKVNSAEYKVMGLAPYGDPNKYYDHFKKIITVFPDGSFKLNQKYFAYEYGLRMTNKNFDRLFGGPARNPESPLEQRHKDIAAALQKVTEEVVLKMANYLYSLYPVENLCLAGGVALNCVANGRLLREGPFKNIYIQPASGDAGGAIGAAAYLYFSVLKNAKEKELMPSIYLGPDFKNEDVKNFLIEQKVNYQFFENNSDLTKTVANLIAQNQVIGWFQGKMEFGPRALGNRSILADARNRENWQRVNLKIKFRESFRPFAPSALLDKADDCFDLRGAASPYMLLVAAVKNDKIPAVTHVDNSARIQTVSQKENSLYYDLISEFNRLTGCPVIINTSFNVRGEPIVCSPADAFNCFANTDMDYLVLNNFIVSKKDNPHLDNPKNKEAYLKSFKLD